VGLVGIETDKKWVKKVFIGKNGGEPTSPYSKMIHAAHVTSAGSGRCFGENLNLRSVGEKTTTLQLGGRITFRQYAEKWEGGGVVKLFPYKTRTKVSERSFFTIRKKGKGRKRKAGTVNAA